MIIKYVDAKSLGYCDRGARLFCKRHKINWWVFVKQGVESSEVAHIDDEMVKKVFEAARLRELNEQGAK